MKKYLIFLVSIILFCLSSCTTEYQVTSEFLLNNELDKVAIKLEDKGYYQTGKSVDTRNEITVTGHSYTELSGFGNRLENSPIKIQTYTFENNNGNTMEYSISYQSNQYDTIYYVTNTHIQGCKTSNPQEYYNLCGSSSPIYLIDEMPHDYSIVLLDKEKTLGVGTFISVVFCVAIFVISGTVGTAK